MSTVVCNTLEEPRSIRRGPTRGRKCPPITRSGWQLYGHATPSPTWNRGFAMTTRRVSCGFALIGFIAIALMATALLAHAQIFDLPTESPIFYPLDAEDWELIHKSAVPLFSTDAVGQLQRWANPQNGKKGSIELMRLYQLKGMPCRRMEYVTFVPSRSEPSRSIVDWCQIATGQWKLVDPLELKGG